MKKSGILVSGIAVMGLLALAAPVQAMDAEEITDELFTDLDAVAK